FALQVEERRPSPAVHLTLVGGRAAVNDVLRETDGRDDRAPDRNVPARAYTLDLVAGKTYQIDLSSREFDSLLRLEGPAGDQVAQDDDSGGNLDARIVYRCTQTGRYRVIATTLNRGGNFGLQVQER